MTLTIITAESADKVLTFTVGSAAEASAIKAHLEGEGYTVTKSTIRGSVRSKGAQS